MSDAKLTRYRWVRLCAQRYEQQGGVPCDVALEFAGACAEQQEHDVGFGTTGWGAPADAADEDMAQWEP